MKPLVFATVGTDHHPFDRLVEWIDAWCAGADVECIVQHGHSREPGEAVGARFLRYDEMESLLRRAHAVVTHGGPSTIMLALGLGKRPIVVPRRRALGEHVDDHQVVFAERLAREGTIVLADDAATLARLLDGALAAPDGLRAEANAGGNDEAVARFEELVDGLFAREAVGV